VYRLEVRVVRGKGPENTVGLEVVELKGYFSDDLSLNELRRVIMMLLVSRLLL